MTPARKRAAARRKAENRVERCILFISIDSIDQA
jgi:hypothetical protein